MRGAKVVGIKEEEDSLNAITAYEAEREREKMREEEEDGEEKGQYGAHERRV